MFALKQKFRFLPDWRFDDVMVSFSTPGGSVGAHLDEYDVFLLQGQGKKRWKIESSARSLGEDVFYEELDLKLLKHFKPDESWAVGPGDLLYLPPRHAHHGVALEECTTLSIGLRAPSNEELITAILAETIEELDEGMRYSDADLTKATQSPGEIDQQVLRRLDKMVRQYLLDPELLLRSFGRLVTNPVRADDLESFNELEAASDSKESILAARQQLQAWKKNPDTLLLRDPALRTAYHVDSKSGEVIFFFRGTNLRLPESELPLVRTLCEESKLEWVEIAPHLKSKVGKEVLLKLIALDYYYFSPS